jgi:hypothetical protein
MISTLQMTAPMQQAPLMLQQERSCQDMQTAARKQQLAAMAYHHNSSRRKRSDEGLQ